MSLRSALVLVALVAIANLLYAADLPLFDAHIHYNHDAWESALPKEAIARLRNAGVVRALVSSSSDEGTQRLYAEMPDLIVPELRPYRKNGADLPVVRSLVQLVKQHGLMLHAHSDADAIERLFHQDPEARIIWAHAGYEQPGRMPRCCTATRTSGRNSPPVRT